VTLDLVELGGGNHVHGSCNLPSVLG